MKFSLPLYKEIGDYIGTSSMLIKKLHLMSWISTSYKTMFRGSEPIVKISVMFHVSIYICCRYRQITVTIPATTPMITGIFLAFSRLVRKPIILIILLSDLKTLMIERTHTWAPLCAD